MSCLGDYGGLIYPYTVFGGFPGESHGDITSALKYLNSTAILITFLINNNVDPNSMQIRMAEAWEAEFIRFMKKISNPNMTISFIAEVLLCLKSIKHLGNIYLLLIF